MKRVRRCRHSTCRHSTRRLRNARPRIAITLMHTGGLALLLMACSTGTSEQSVQVERTDSAQRAESRSQSAERPSQQVENSQSMESPTRSAETRSQDTAWTTGVIDRTYPTAGAALLEGVRTARHDGYDRIVFDFAGSEVPSYHIEYIDRPVRACGSGEVVDLPGDAWLAIRFEPANAHDEQGRSTVSARAFAPGLPTLIELRATCDFEAVVEWVAAVRTPARFRVSELRSPTRLVIDLRR